MHPLDLVHKLLGADLVNILLPRGVDFRHDDFIRRVEGLRELVEQRKGPGIGMGLEQAPQILMRNVLSRFQRRLDFRRMVRVIVHDGDAASP